MFFLKIKRWLPNILMVTIFLSTFLTYIILRKQSDLNQMSQFGVLYANLILLLLLLAIVLKRWFRIFWVEKVGKVVYRLQRQIIILFGVVSILPGVLVAIFASLFFNLGVQAWFGEPVKQALSESQAVINAYIKEHERNLGYEALQIATYLQPKLEKLIDDRDAFDAELNEVEDKFFFNESIVLTSQQRILGKSQLTFSLELSPIDAKDFKIARTKGIETYIDKDRIRALVLLDDQNDIYLWLGKAIDKKILDHIQKNKNALSLYKGLEEKRSGFEYTFLIIFSLITLLLLLIAIWVGLNIANRMINPISKLIYAAQKVSSGNLDVQVSTEHFNNELDTLVSSFNTMTSQLKKQQQELIMSEKKATWSDIARKIAHEIKNPLTPIQLSAERLKRRYLKQINNDPETFEQCINTIIRQVSHIETLVREFSNFARMPDAKMQEHDILYLMNECLILQKSANSNIIFVQHFADENVKIYCDRQQIEQVLINLIQNSINCLIENKIEDPTISVHLLKEASQIIIIVEDNGIGFPKIGREKLTEPYYTTREKGTGLGLAIVQKIITDHGGSVLFGDSVLGGAMVTLIFNTKDNEHGI